SRSPRRPSAPCPHATPPPAATPLADAFARIGAAEALAIEPGSRAVPVAVIDTGVALEHVEFGEKLLTGFDTVDLGIGLVGGEVSLVGDSVGRDFCARDETGHGSHVAGIIGARGAAMARGLAGRSPIIPVRALAAARMAEGPVFGIGGLADIDAAIKVAVDLGARVLNMSFGTSRGDLDAAAPPPHEDVIAYANAHGCICVAAMGNSGQEEEFFPAALPGVIAVGSMALDGSVSEFSTTGAHVALCAPGEEIVSAGLEGYRASTGTSHAAPFVSATAALLAARAQRLGHRLTGEEARRALCLSAKRPGEPDTRGGWGMLDAPAALAFLDQMPLSNQEDNA
ncbi:MAG: S8 family serine peptidase, partial [Roseovarius sp.]